MLLVFVSPVGATCSNYTVTRLSRLACVLLDKVQVPCALEFYNFTRICLHVANGASVPAVCVLLPPFASNSLVTLGHETVGTLYSHVLDAVQPCLADLSAFGTPRSTNLSAN
jgi:hypothetical protein